MQRTLAQRREVRCCREGIALAADSHQVAEEQQQQESAGKNRDEPPPVQLSTICGMLGSAGLDQASDGNNVADMHPSHGDPRPGDPPPNADTSPAQPAESGRHASAGARVIAACSAECGN